MPTTKYNYSFRKYLLSYFSLALIGALGGLIYLLLLEADPKNQLFLGFSLSRLLLISFFFVAITIAAYFGYKCWHAQEWSRKTEKILLSNPNFSNWALGISLCGFFISGLLLLIPFYKIEQFSAYAERLQPIIIYIAQINFQTILLILQIKQRLHWKSFFKELDTYRPALWLSGGIFGIFIALWRFISLTKIGIDPTPNTIWFESGVPILGIQILFIGLVAGFLSGIALWVNKKFNGHQPTIAKWLDIIFAFCLWGLAAFLWNKAPIIENYFAPGPFPPDNAYLPYSDAAAFDMSAQYALVGNGIANRHASIDHSAYIGSLAFLHLVTGQDFSRLVALQVNLFAVLPVLLYFIGKKFHSQFLGIFLAGLVITQEINAIHSGSRLNLSHSKLLLTEFPTKILIAASILLLLTWLRKSNQQISYALPLGGVLGLAIMTRYNTLVIPFAVIAGITLIFGKRWKAGLKASVILIVAIGVTISPWMWRSWRLSGNPLFFMEKTSVVINQDFSDETESSSKVDSDVNDESQNHEDQIIPKKQLGAVYFKVNHFIHNLITNLLILPTRPILDNLPAAITDNTFYENMPYWKNIYAGWLADLTWTDRIGIAINLCLIAFGMGLSHQKLGITGLIPMGILLVYHISTAMAPRSGGRFIVPVDWIILIYFGVGLLQFSKWSLVLLGQKFEKKSHPNTEKTLYPYTGVLLLLPFFFYVVAMTAIDQAIPQRYVYLTTDEILAKLDQEVLFEQTELTKTDLEAFLKQPDAEIYLGMNLFPRFLWRNRGISGDVYLHKPFPRLATTIVTWKDYERAMLPLMEPPAYFPNGSDIIIIGCHNSANQFGYVDAFLFAVLGDQSQIYTRTPQRPLACPMPEPDCENNRICQ